MIDRDAFLRSISLLKGMRNNLPKGLSIKSSWARDYDNAIMKIEEAEGIVLNEYKIGQTELKRIEVSGNYLTGEVNYSDDFYCDRAVMLQKIDSALIYLENYLMNDNKIMKTNENSSFSSKKVFIVHGHNEGIKQSVARLVEKLDIEAIILHEQPNKGRTIIEKFVEYSDVNFAIVLLTADDIGRQSIKSDDSLKPRARQNVILELGFFLGKLGRSNVCALYEEGVEIPSDYQGVIFVPLDDSGNWKFSISKELKEAGLDVDMNKII
jgi:predicted nucleotide-binding protein